MPPDRRPQDAVMHEFIAYYNSDADEDFVRQSVDEWAWESACRLFRVTGNRQAEVSLLLRSLAADKVHPLIEPLEIASLTSWTGEIGSWRLFQSLATAIAGRIDALLAEPATGDG